MMRPVSDRAITIEQSLVHLAGGPGHHVWIGEHPPLDFVGLSIRKCTNFRLSSAHHGKYDTVWYYEESPAQLQAGQAELVFDELIRLVGSGGRLIVRFRNNIPHFTIIGLKHLLARRYNTTVTVESESACGGWFTIVFGIRRHGIDRYQSDRWTFAVLTRGTRVQQVVEFCRSIRGQDPVGRHEILVWGPCNAAYEPFGVTCHDGHGYRDELAEISRKKNDIAERASCPNLMIVHDRYRIDDGFFAGFERFGYDFDFATVPQRYECGSHFPAYAALEKGVFRMGRSIDCRDYNALRDGQYINGGLTIVKTETLRDLRFNDMLFWNQWEDVELTHHFRTRGLPPRVNCSSSATTLGITPAYTKDFLPERGPMAYVGDVASAVRGGFKSTILAGGKRIERRLRPVFKKLFEPARSPAGL